MGPGRNGHQRLSLAYRRDVRSPTVLKAAPEFRILRKNTEQIVVVYSPVSGGPAAPLGAPPARRGTARRGCDPTADAQLAARAAQHAIRDGHRRLAEQLRSLGQDNQARAGREAQRGLAQRDLETQPFQRPREFAVEVVRTGAPQQIAPQLKSDGPELGSPLPSPQQRRAEDLREPSVVNVRRRPALHQPVAHLRSARTARHGTLPLEDSRALQLNDVGPTVSACTSAAAASSRSEALPCSQRRY